MNRHSLRWSIFYNAYSLSFCYHGNTKLLEFESAQLYRENNFYHFVEKVAQGGNFSLLTFSQKFQRESTFQHICDDLRATYFFRKIFTSWVSAPLRGSAPLWGSKKLWLQLASLATHSHCIYIPCRPQTPTQYHPSGKFVDCFSLNTFPCV